MFKVKITNRDEASIFLAWAHEMEAPFDLQINERPVLRIKDAIHKLFWLTGFETLINEDFQGF